MSDYQLIVIGAGPGGYTAALQAASWLAGGQPDTLGVTLVLDAQRTLRARRLRAHPGCGCGAAG